MNVETNMEHSTKDPKRIIYDKLRDALAKEYEAGEIDAAKLVVRELIAEWNEIWAENELKTSIAEMELALQEAEATINIINKNLQDAQERLKRICNTQ